MGREINKLAAPEVPDLNYGQLHVDIILPNYTNEKYKIFENRDKVNCLVSTYVVCERLSVMHEPAGV